MVERVSAKIRGLSQYYANGLERQEIWIEKRLAGPLPQADNLRVPVSLVIGKESYEAGIRATPKNAYVCICPNMKDGEGGAVSLAKVLGTAGFKKNQTVVLEVEGCNVRVVPSPFGKGVQR